VERERGLHDGEYKFARQMDYVFVYAVCNLRTTRVIHTRYNYIHKEEGSNPAYCNVLHAGPICCWTLDPIFIIIF
jgi:hypothetical protein